MCLLQQLLHQGSWHRISRDKQSGDGGLAHLAEIQHRCDGVGLHLAGGWLRSSPGYILLRGICPSVRWPRVLERKLSAAAASPESDERNGSTSARYGPN